jgi:hypothetical protein
LEKLKVHFIERTTAQTCYKAQTKLRNTHGQAQLLIRKTSKRDRQETEEGRKAETQSRNLERASDRWRASVACRLTKRLPCFCPKHLIPMRLMFNTPFRKAMKTAGVQIDVTKFDAWTSGNFKGEQLDIFRCSDCKTIFIGLPDSHKCLINSNDAKQKTDYGLPRKTTCAVCGQIWHDGKTKWNVEAVSDEEFKTSPWRWLQKG